MLCVLRVLSGLIFTAENAKIAQSLAKIYYSLLKDFTGLVNAALIDWKLIVIQAMINAMNPAIPKIHQPISTLY